MLNLELMTRSGCPIAATLDLVGDKWSLVIVRDMLMGKRRYGEFLASPEGITTNILADRLKRMEDLGLISKAPYQKHPPRYDSASRSCRSSRPCAAGLTRTFPIPGRRRRNS
jgi:DNA-binding HxlR family transcriptional regulator